MCHRHSQFRITARMDDIDKRCSSISPSRSSQGDHAETTYWLTQRSRRKKLALGMDRSAASAYRGAALGHSRRLGSQQSNAAIGRKAAMR